jgi:outer membrane protein insertion porin family
MIHFPKSTMYRQQQSSSRRMSFSQSSGVSTVQVCGIVALSLVSNFSFAAAAGGQSLEGSNLEPSNLAESQTLARRGDRTPQAESEIPTAPDGTIVTEIQVRFVDREGASTEGQTRSHIIRREFELKPNDPYNRELVAEGLTRVEALDSIRRASVLLEPTIDPNRVILIIVIVERSSFVANLQASAPRPNGLEGPLQSNPVDAGATIDSNLLIGGSIGWRNLGGRDQDLLLRLQGGENVLNGDLSFRDPGGSDRLRRWGFGVNLFNQRAIQDVYTGGNQDVDLPGGTDAPWVHRIGGGVQVFRPLSDQSQVAIGLSYQRVAIRDDIFSTDTFAQDQLGNRLTYGNGEDDLLTLSVALDSDRRNDTRHPTRGSRISAGIDQAIPIGSSQIAFTRLSGYYTQYLPLPLFGFARGDRTFVFNLQGGIMFGDVPGYEAFTLSQVRGYADSSFATGSSFVQATAEYRFPIANLRLFRQSVQLRGVFFGDYGSDLGTADEVYGLPAIARDKPGDALGYGVGLRAEAPVGTARLEFAWSDEGDNEVTFSIGDRF